MVQLGEMRADVQLDFQDAKEESEKVQSEAKEENEKVKNETLCMMRATGHAVQEVQLMPCLPLPLPLTVTLTLTLTLPLTLTVTVTVTLTLTLTLTHEVHGILHPHPEP